MAAHNNFGSYNHFGAEKSYYFAEKSYSNYGAERGYGSNCGVEKAGNDAVGADPQRFSSTPSSSNCQDWQNLIGMVRMLPTMTDPPPAEDARSSQSTEDAGGSSSQAGSEDELFPHCGNMSRNLAFVRPPPGLEGEQVSAFQSTRVEVLSRACQATAAPLQLGKVEPPTPQTLPMTRWCSKLCSPESAEQETAALASTVEEEPSDMPSLKEDHDDGAATKEKSARRRTARPRICQTKICQTLFKTRICEKWEQGSCPWAANKCLYAHGEEQLRRLRRRS